MHVLELNDGEVRVGVAGKILARSPGCAVLLDDTLHLGADAAKLAHLHPRQTYNRFWTNLNEDPLAVPAGRYRHHADLAYAHLKAVHEQAGKPAELVLAVPGSSSNEQLSLLLGIVQALPFKAVGLVDTAVAAAASVTGPGRYQAVDLGLHRAVLTRIAANGGVSRESVEALENSGIAAVHDAAAALIADLFIEQCRFDPLHNAETEQALYDQVPECLRRIATQPEVRIEIRYRGARNEVQLARGPLLRRLEPIYQGILRRLEPGRVTLLGDRAAALPGFAALIPGAFALPAEAVFRGCEEHRAAIVSSGAHLNYVTRLPLAASPAAGLDAMARHAAAAPAAAATHILIGARALRLRSTPLFLSARGRLSPERFEGAACGIGLGSAEATVTPLSDITMYVNGERVTGPRQLAAGDRIGFAGSDTVCTLISVDDGDAA